MSQERIIIDCEALAKQGGIELGSIRPSIRLSIHPFVCVFVRALLAEPFNLCNQWAYVDNRTDASDRLLLSNELKNQRKGVDLDNMGRYQKEVKS